MEAQQQEEPSLDLSFRLLGSVLEQLEARVVLPTDIFGMTCNFTGFICCLLFCSLSSYILDSTYNIFQLFQKQD